MSYRWDGFRMTARTLDEALDVVSRFRPVASSMLHAWHASWLATKATQLLDRATLQGKPLESSPLSLAYEEFDRRRLKIVREEIRDPSVDSQFDLILLKYKNRIHGLVLAEQEAWRQAWFDLPEIEDFGWWDSSDRPDDVSAKTWRERKNAWKAMIPNAWPAEQGVLIHLNPRYFHSTTESIFTALPTIKSRRRYQALDIAVQSRMNEIMPKETMSDQNVHAILAASTSASRWLLTPDGERSIADIEANLDLKPITMEMLTRHPASRTP